MGTLLKDLDITFNRPQECVACSIDHALYTKTLRGPKTHQARLQRHIERAIQHPPMPVLFPLPSCRHRGRRTQAFQFSVGTRIAGLLHAVAAFGKDSAFGRDKDGPDRNLLCRKRSLGLDQGELHEIVVVGVVVVCVVKVMGGFRLDDGEGGWTLVMMVRW